MRVSLLSKMLLVLALVGCGVDEQGPRVGMGRMPRFINAPVIFEGREPMVASNADSVAALSTLARGEITDIAATAQGETVAVASTAGVWLYITNAPDERPRLLTTPTGLLAVALSADGTLVAGGGTNRIVYLWRVSDGQLLASQTQHEARVTDLAFSPDDTLLISTSDDRTARVWLVSSNELSPLTLTLPHNDVVTAVDFYPTKDSDGRWLVATGALNRTVHLWLLTGTSVESLTTLDGFGGSVSSLSFSSNGAFLAGGSRDFNGLDNTVHLFRVQREGTRWSLTEGGLLFGHADVVNAVRFSTSDPNVLASASADDTLILWRVAPDAGSAQVIEQLRGHTGDAVAVAFTQSELFSGSTDGTLRMWGALDGTAQQVIRGHISPITSLAVSAEGRYIATGNVDNTVHLWDITTGNEISVLRGPQGAVLSVAFSPDGKFIAAGSRDVNVYVWAMRDALSQSELLLDDVVRVLGSQQTIYGERIGHSDDVRSVAFSPDSRLLASAGCGRVVNGTCAEGEVRLWDAVAGLELAALFNHTDAVESVAFSADGALLASGGRDSIIRMWDVETGQEFRALRGHGDWVDSLAFSPDGLYLASGSVDDTAQIWEVGTGNPLAFMAPATRNYSCADFTRPDRQAPVTETEAQAAGLLCDDVTGVVFSPVGSLVATASKDNLVRLWDVKSGTQLNILSGHNADVSAIAFTPNGTVLISAGADGTLRLWGIR